MRQKKLQDHFDNPIQRSCRTDPDYVERKLLKMVHELLSLEGQDRLTYFQGLDGPVRCEVLVRLRRWPEAEGVRIFLDEAERCLTKASAPHGAACVTGKALDLLLHLLRYNLKGTLGPKLRDLKQFAKRNPGRLHITRATLLVAELLRMWAYLETRNSAAHYRVQKPEISIAEAKDFYKKVFRLYEMEKDRQKDLADELEWQVRGKGIL